MKLAFYFKKLKISSPVLLAAAIDSVMVFNSSFDIVDKTIPEEYKITEEKYGTEYFIKIYDANAKIENLV